MEQKTSVKKLVTLTVVAVFLLSLVGQVACSGASSSDLQEVQRAYDISGVTALWNMGYTGSGMKVAMIDEGVDYTHPDLGGCLGPNCKVIGGWNFERNNGDPMIGPDPTYHGTLLALQMVANGPNLKGVAPDAKLLAYRLMNDDYDFRVLERAIDDGADVVNFSYGFTPKRQENNFYKGFESKEAERVYMKAEEKGTLVFISPGNFGSALLETAIHTFPVFHAKAYYMPVGERVSEYTTLSIGAYDVFADGGEIAEYSSIGPSLNGEMQPDMLAYVGYPNPALPQFSRFGGTSCSAPFAGAVATLIKQAHPNWSALDIRAALMNTASVLYNKITGEPVSVMIQGSGLINPVAAVNTTAFITPYEINMTATGLKPVELAVKNIANATQTFTATVQPTLGNYEYGQNQGLTLSLTATQIVVGPHKTATLALLASADLNTLSKGSHEALIWFSNGTATLHVPVAIWNDLNSIWWYRDDPYDVGWNEQLPPKLINVRASYQPDVVIDFTINRGTFVPWSAGTAEPFWSNYAEHVTVDILDANSKLVKTIFDKNHLLLGHYQAVWDGRDANGKFVPDGTYTYIVKMPDTFTNWDIPIVDTHSIATGTITVKDGFKDVSFTPPQYLNTKYGPDKPLPRPEPTPSDIPTLTFTVPQELIQVPKYVFEDSVSYTFTGTTDPYNTLTVEHTYFLGRDESKTDNYTVKVNPDGSFTFTVNLKEGTNYLTFKAVNPSNGRFISKAHTVYAYPANLIELKVGKETFTVNKETVKSLDSPPIIKNSRTLVPIRAIVETMGGAIKWYPADRRVDIQYKDQNISLWIGMNIAKVNGKNTMIDPDNPNVVPEIINGRTMLPLRFVAEALGCQVEWIEQTKTIKITYQD